MEPTQLNLFIMLGRMATNAFRVGFVWLGLVGGALLCNAEEKEEWTGSARAKFSANTGSRLIAAVAKSKPVTITVNQGSQSASGELVMDTSTIEMLATRDKLVYEKVVQKSLKSVVIKQADLALSATKPKDSKPTELPLILDVNGKEQNVTAEVVTWTITDGKLKVQAKFVLSLKSTPLKIPSAIKLKDQVEVAIEVLVTPKTK